MLISYDGKSTDTKYWQLVQDDQRQSIRDEYYRKPDYDDVCRQLQKIADGGMATNLVTRYYIRDVMSKVRLHRALWSIEDVFNSNELLGHCLAKIRKHSKIYPDTTPIDANLDALFRIGGGLSGAQTSEFPIKGR